MSSSRCASDGEGYAVNLVLAEDASIWQRLIMPYTHGMARDSTEGLIDPPDLIAGRRAQASRPRARQLLGPVNSPAAQAMREFAVLWRFQEGRISAGTLATH